MDHISIPLAKIQSALATLHHGLVNHEAVDAGDMDRSVTTLAGAHDQIGGSTRRVLYQLFAAAARDDATEEIEQVLEYLISSIGAPPADDQFQLVLFDVVQKPARRD